jgi:uncharacterized protein (TIGR03435 family)
MKGILYVLFAGVLLAQTASFDAASIKPSEAPDGSSSGITTRKGFMRAGNVTLKRCISGAYGVPEAQIIGGPPWIGDLRFDIAAKTDQPAGDAELMSMLQTLMADRFHLALHHQTETISGYSLIVAKGGIKAVVSDPETEPTTNTSRARIEAKGCPMWRLVSKLAGILGVPVVDATADSRSFDFTLKWIPDAVMAKAAPGSDAANGPSIFTAVQEQLGLKMEARKVPVDTLVIDHVEPPSEN